MGKRPATATPVRMALTLGLKHEGNLVAAASRTYQGQASWGGEGPPNAVCRECRYWVASGKWDKSTGGGVGTPKPSRCRKAQVLSMSRVPTARIPHDAEACRHFELAECPQPINRPPKGVWS